MFKRIFTLIFALISVYKLYSQNDSVNIFQIQYERTLTFENDPRPLVFYYEYTKFIELNKSIYAKRTSVKKTEVLTEDEDDDAILYFTPSGNNISVVFKDYDKNSLYSKHEVAYKYFVVKDSLDIFNWQIEDSTKNILGYKCQKAIMDFRGREYIAWFTSKLPVGGPWKFDGLPGMILELKSIDNFITFRAVSVRNEVKLMTSIENPFDTDKTLTWDEFKALYKRKAIELVNYRPNENALGIKSSRGGIETYIAEDDKEYNEALKKLANN